MKIIFILKNVEQRFWKYSHFSYFSFDSKRVFSNQLDRHTSSQQDIRLSVRPSKRENAVVDPITY